MPSLSVHTLERETVFKDADWEEGFILVSRPNPQAQSASKLFQRLYQTLELERTCGRFKLGTRVVFGQFITSQYAIRMFS